MIKMVQKYMFDDKNCDKTYVAISFMKRDGMKMLVVNYRTQEKNDVSLSCASCLSSLHVTHLVQHNKVEQLDIYLLI